MSKKKLLIQEVFDKAREDFPNKNSKSGLSSELSDFFESNLKFVIHEKTFTRYYDAYIGNGKEMDIKDIEILDKLSQYLDFKNFVDFTKNFAKKEEPGRSTKLKIDVDDEELLSENVGNNIRIIINQHFKMPEFLKQNGMGIMEISFLICLVTGNVLFSNNRNEHSNRISPLSFMSNGKPAIEKKYMYWNGERYLATDSSYINPGVDIVAMNVHKLLYFKKILRKDTLTDLNAVGKTWYSKYNNEVVFFTDDGVDPENGRELRKSTPLIIFKYAGKQKDSVVLEE